MIDTIARREEENTAEHGDVSVNHGDKADELNYELEMKIDCDWIIRSFTDRNNANEAELNGLLTAKEYLAVVKITSLIQIPRSAMMRSPVIASWASRSELTLPA